jgi:hypothetical protein
VRHGSGGSDDDLDDHALELRTHARSDDDDARDGDEPRASSDPSRSGGDDLIGVGGGDAALRPSSRLRSDVDDVRHVDALRACSHEPSASRSDLACRDERSPCAPSTLHSHHVHDEARVRTDVLRRELF